MIRLLKTAAPAFAAVLALAGCRDKTAYDSGAELLSEPPMWSVSDKDSEVILYPTVHILPPGIEWQSERLDAAIARSGEVWYELGVGATETAEFQQVAIMMGMDTETLLSARLPAETRAKLESRLAEMSVPMDAVEPMRPWMAAISLPTIQYMQSGYTQTEGVETKLQARADASARGQRALETGEQQLRFFADMSEAEQILLLDRTLDEMDEGVALLDRLANAWATGDVATLETEFITEMKSYPELYDKLVVKRNADWAEQLDAEMRGEGVDFVAVGAGHLVGPDSLPAMMAARGYDVKLLTTK